MANKTLKITQVRSQIGQSERHRGTLRALGLGKIGLPLAARVVARQVYVQVVIVEGVGPGAQNRRVVAAGADEGLAFGARVDHRADDAADACGRLATDVAAALGEIGSRFVGAELSTSRSAGISTITWSTPATRTNPASQ